MDFKTIYQCREPRLGHRADSTISLAMNSVIARVISPWRFESRSYGVTLSNISVSDPCLEVFGLSGALVLCILAIQLSYMVLCYFLSAGTSL